jgi:hypothetical protein
MRFCSACGRFMSMASISCVNLVASIGTAYQAVQFTHLLMISGFDFSTVNADVLQCIVISKYST